MPPDPAAAGRVPRSRTTLIVALALYVAVTIVAGFQAQWNLVDDALILCRYARNAAQGYGPVYNPGERVESDSSPLRVALLSLGDRAGMDLPYLSRALGVLAGAGTVALAALVFPLIFPPFPAACLALIVAADAGPAVWGVSGMETNGFMLILFTTWVVLWSVLRRPTPTGRLLLGGLAGLLALSRPEGAVLGAIAVAASCAAPGPGPRRGLAILPYAVILAAFTAWRVGFYGAWWPNTVTAKFLPEGKALARGAVDAAAFLFRRWPLVIAAGAALITRGTGERGARAWRTSAALACGALVLETVIAGGDWMGRDRLPGPMIPILVMLAGLGLCTSRASAPRRSVIVLFAAACISFSWWHADWIPPHQRVAARLGEWMAAAFPADTRLGVSAAGTIPFYTGFRTMDALGIADPAIASTPPPPRADWKPGHMRYDTRRFLAWKPDVIVWEFGTRWCLARLADEARDPGRRAGDYRRELLWSPEFRKNYRMVSGAPRETEGAFTVFQRIGDDASAVPDSTDR